ncbi:MAG: DUF4145 domain-containing protein [Deltaproteobacteria bacterium]|nr:DUF4145 domain-containing protein [Deltaproteobacteria bacterium]
MTKDARENALPLKCPYCVEILHDTQIHRHVKDKDGVWEIFSTTCSSCRKVLILLTTEQKEKEAHTLQIEAWAKELNRTALPPEVVEPYASDYYEACFVLADSPRASAALSRLCLQKLLREKGGVQHGDLTTEIDQVLAAKTLPPEIASMVAGITDVGNFAAESRKATQPGLVLDVAPGEAEYILEALECLFDFYFVTPARVKEKSYPSDEEEARARSIRGIVTYVSAASRD